MNSRTKKILQRAKQLLDVPNDISGVMLANPMLEIATNTDNNASDSFSTIIEDAEIIIEYIPEHNPTELNCDIFQPVTDSIVFTQDVILTENVIAYEVSKSIEMNKENVEEVNPVNLTQEEELNNTQNVITEVSENAEVENKENNEQETADIMKNRQAKKCVRKIVRNPEKWNNIRKKLCQAGKEYVSSRGKTVAAKRIIYKKNCLDMCKFKCSRKVGEDARNKLFSYYYELNHHEKYVFLKQNTDKFVKNRKTRGDNSRRNFSFRYFLTVDAEKVQVCKQFFTSTLNISQKPVYTAHTTDDEGTAKKDMRGRTGIAKIADERKQIVIDHIKMFNVVESHYCRAKTNRKYLEANLTLPKMYQMYLTYCEENIISTPVKMSMYRRIFSTNFNYGFHKPKQDVCEICFNYHLKVKESRLTDTENQEVKRHFKEKDDMRKEKENDKKSGIPVLCFDLENVITCPKSFVGNHFYLPKLSMYNLTAHLSTTNKAYCALWIESLQGRSGNCIASAFKKIVERVLEDNHVEELITWSDSCVPQNRNSYISFCALDILRNHPYLKSITMKYSVPGHGAVQEVNNLHSQIERHMSKIQFSSPLSFIRELKQVNKKDPFIIIQMKAEDFKDFEKCSKQLQYVNVPFTKVCAMKFTNNDLAQVSYKISYEHKDVNIKVSINPPLPTLTRLRKRKITTQPIIENLVPNVLEVKPIISKEKIDAIKKMMGSMPQIDADFYKALLSL